MPYLDTEEVCEDVEFQECVDAEVQVRQTEQCNGSENVNVICLLLHRCSLRNLTTVLVLFPRPGPHQGVSRGGPQPGHHRQQGDRGHRCQEEEEVIRLQEQRIGRIVIVNNIGIGVIIIISCVLCSLEAYNIVIVRLVDL